MEKEMPEGFRESVMARRDIDGASLLAALDGPATISVKINRRKGASALVGGINAVEELTGYEGLEPVPWCGSGFYLPERRPFTLNPLMHGGVFYVQEPASMIYESIVARHAAGKPPGLALDMCAAPGGKSTSIINALPDGWRIVANEFVPSRAAVLRENLIKWGYPDITVTNADTAAFARTPLFSIVAVDAPCSGEGMMRKEPVARTQWSPALVRQCAALQKNILANAVDALLPGGLLIYSTCTFNTTENDDNLQWLIDSHGLEPVELDFPGVAAGTTLRFMPHITRAEGLFVALLRKPGSLQTPKKSAKNLERILKGCRILADGIPEELAPLSTDFDMNKYPVADITLETALDYLRHNALQLPDDAPRGLTVVAYKGHPLGFVKNIGNRANNMYPKEWRIRNL